MRKGSAIDDDGTAYLWPRRFVMGAINIIFSRPGAGKSTIGANLAGHVSVGQRWPDGATCESGSVIYCKGEGSDRAIRDRLRMAGADMDRVHVVGRAEDDDTDDSPMLDLAGVDAGLLYHEIVAIGDVKLLIVDTLDSLYPSMRMIDNGHIRKCLWPVQEMAERLGICVVVLAHTNKGGYRDPLDRLSGGRAIGGSARSVWYLGQQDRESESYYMASVKINDFRPAATIEYCIVGVGEDTPGAIRWGETNPDLSAWHLDNPPKAERGKTEDCVEWMRGRLELGPELLRVFKSACEAAGYGDHCYSKARRELGIESKPQKGKVPPDYWACLPGQEAPLPPTFGEEEAPQPL
ncbi:MAG: AAA family ATPase [Planctomycetota bacterium]